MVQTAAFQTRLHPTDRYKIDLAGMQSLCTANYGRLVRIARNALCGRTGTIERLSTKWNSHHTQTQLEVLEQTRYTTVINLKLLTPLHRWLSQPEFIIRLYHDVRIAEVIAADQHRNLAPVYVYPNPAMHMPDEKHQLNQLLAEWLEHHRQTEPMPETTHRVVKLDRNPEQ